MADFYASLSAQPNDRLGKVSDLMPSSPTSRRESTEGEERML